ncbi:MAG: hypothetical protein LBR37_04080 [Erysipelotrichaceae bacterium]|jgi:replication initiation and membrane attachment protein|nr:hypothetical protein [Erysipelotrichaceae bacterium]
MKIYKSDLFVAHQGNEFLSEDNTNLVRLYLPLIGPGAYALYAVLKNYAASHSLSHEEHFVKDLWPRLYQIDERNFETAIGHLEGTGLLRTYVDTIGRRHIFHFVVFAPLPLKDFLEDRALCHLLVDRIGALGVQNIIDSNVLNPEYLKHQDVTLSFEEVFSLSDETPQLANQDKVLKTNQTRHLSLDLNKLEEILLSNNISLDMFSSSEIDAIIALFVVFNHTIEEYATLLLESIVINAPVGSKLDVPTLKKKLTFTRQIGVKRRGKRQQEILTGNSSIIKFANYLNATHPIAFLESKQQGIPLNDSDRFLVSELISNGISFGVINTVLDYVLKENNNRLSKPYINKIMGTVLRSKAQDALATMEVLKKDRRKKVTAAAETESLDPPLSEAEIQKLLDDLS